MALFVRRQRAVRPIRSARHPPRDGGERVRRGLLATWEAIDDDPILLCGCDLNYRNQLAPGHEAAAPASAR
jgi:hypothetical protein